jgi:hypothetical protein
MPERRNTDAALHKNTVISGRMNTNNVHLSNQISVRIESPVNPSFCSYGLLA